MADLGWLSLALQSLLITLPGTLVWIAAFVVGVIMVTHRHTLPGGLLIAASLLSALGLVLDVAVQWASWNLYLADSSSTLLTALGGLNVLIGFLAITMLIAAVWLGRKPTEQL